MKEPADMPIAFPKTMEEVTPSWLSQALSARWPGTEVGKAESTAVVHGTATKVLFELTYHDEVGTTRPSSVCVKAPFEPHAEMMAPTGIYETEALFFRDIRPSLAVSAPASYYADVDLPTRFGIIVLEDLNLRGATFLRPTVPVTVDQVAAALEGLARFHASWWGSPRLDDHPWLDLMVTEGNASGAYFKTLGPDVIARRLAQPTRGPVIPAGLHDPDRIVQAFWAWTRTLPPGPHCLIHGDSHVGNSYLLPDGTVGLCDWQTVRRGRWAHDVSYFVGSALDPERRARSERDLVRHYLDQLARQGIDPPRFTDAWTDYRRHMMYGFFAWLTNLEEFQPEDYNTTIIRRFATAVVELETYHTLGLD